jgi:MFS family permease
MSSAAGNVSYKSLFEESGRLWFLTATAIGRAPSAMKALACILLVQQITGSYGMAGLVGATQTLVAAVLAPVLARLIDIRGERGILIWSMMAHVIGVVALIWAAYSDLPEASMLVGAAIIGGSSVQFGSLSRARWVRELGRGRALEKAYSLESMVDEMGFVIGPMLVVPLCLQVHPTAGILASMIFTAIGTLMLIMQPTSRGFARMSSPITSEAHRVGGSVVQIPAVQLIIASLMFMGVLFGAAEIVIVAFTEHNGSPNSASYVAAIFAIGSLLGAVLYGARQWPGSTPMKIMVTYWWIGLGTIPMLLAPNIPAMAVAVFITGLAISPGMIVSNLFVEQIAPPNKLTEAFAWLGSAMATGAAIGSIIAGYLVDQVGIRGAQWSVVTGGVACGLIVTFGWKLLRSPESEPIPA